jgi:hypothetical protein
MMMSPEAYYEFHLKGKDEERILRAIRGLKREMGHLKNVMEHPDYDKTPHIMPSESTRLSCKRLYFEEAKRALAEEGGTYQPSQAELKAAAFDENIPYISKLVFSIGDFCTGHETTTIRLDEKHLYKTVEGFPILTPSNFHIPPDYPRGKDEFLRSLAKLHIGEWRSSYTLKRFGYYVCDGTQWELDIFFSNGHKPVHIYGDNAYPYNFREFQELMGRVPDEEDEAEHYRNILIESVENIVDAADELRAKNTLNEVEYGQLIAYAECLCIIRDACDRDELEDFGLGFDIDGKYLVKDPRIDILDDLQSTDGFVRLFLTSGETMDGVPDCIVWYEDEEGWDTIKTIRFEPVGRTTAMYFKVEDIERFELM